jgi:hypothetical protein
MKTTSLAFALIAVVVTPTFADDITLACKGKFEARGQGDPMVEEVTGSVVVGSNWVSISFVPDRCTITASRPNGIDFKCPLPPLGAGWHWERTGYLDRYNGDFELSTTKAPPNEPGKFGSTETYVLTCKPATRMF